MSESQNAGSVLRRKVLKDYLNTHLLAAHSGVRMFQAAAKTWKGSVHADRFAELSQQIRSDQDELDTLIKRLGMQELTMQRLLGKVAELAGRLNPLNPGRSKTHEAAQIEIDLLQGIVESKGAMWHMLANLADRVPELLDRSDFERLYQRAEDQKTEIRRISEQTMAARFIQQGGASHVDSETDAEVDANADSGTAPNMGAGTASQP